MAFFSIHSDKRATRSTIGQLWHFLSDFQNFKAILPEDKVENFTWSGDQCSFTIRGITELTVRRVAQREFDHLLFSTEGTAQFRFQLKVSFEGEANQPGQCQIEISGDLNPFIKTMAEKPLTGLVNTMAEKLSELNLPAA